MKVYIVTTGMYSDYRINSIFSTSDLAQLYIDTCLRTYEQDDAKIEEFVIDEKTLLITRGYQYYTIHMEKNGNVRECEIDQTEEFSYSFSNPSQWGIDSVSFRAIQAKDKNHAIKIANEKRVQLIANEEWKNIVRDN